MDEPARMPQGQPGVLRVFQSKAETKAFYDKISHVYDLLAEHSEGPVRRAGLEKLGARPGEKVLEIGFGTGHCLASLAQTVGPTGKVYGLDLSEGMLRVARDNLHKAGLAERVELTCGDAVQLPCPPDSLDAIFMSFTLELFDTAEIPKVLAECQRVLRPGGRLAIGGVSAEGEGLMSAHKENVMAKDDWLISRWMSKEVRSVTPAERLVDAFELMQEHRIRHLPVLDKGKLVGIVSDRDVRQYLPTRAHLEGTSSAYSKTLMQTPIKQIMKEHPITVESSGTIREAAEIICREKIGALPVVDDGRLVGIVSSEDLLWAFVDNLQNLRDAWEL